MEAKIGRGGPYLFGDAVAEAHDRTGSYTEAWRTIGQPEEYLTAAWRLNED